MHKWKAKKKKEKENKNEKNDKKKIHKWNVKEQGNGNINKK